jgi:hypothetical protein
LKTIFPSAQGCILYCTEKYVNPTPRYQLRSFFGEIIKKRRELEGKCERTRKTQVREREKEK